MAGKGKQSTQVKHPKKFGTGSVIALFDKTPIPKKKTDVHCPHFWELKYANGCKFDCQWCFLNGTFRFQERGKAPYLKKERMIVNDVTKAITELKDAVLFNAGEVSDGLLFPHALLKNVIPLFKDKDHTIYLGDNNKDVKGLNRANHKLLILTKDNNIRVASYADASDCVIFAWSLNAKIVADEWELFAPSPRERLKAAKQTASYGYEIRFRIDPMVPIPKWEKHYRALVDDIMDVCPTATVITLGSLRGLGSTITACGKNNKDLTWTGFLQDRTNWGKRVPTEVRVEMYKTVIDQFEKREFEGEIALCKESLEVWEELEMKPKDTKCNCML